MSVDDKASWCAYADLVAVRVYPSAATEHWGLVVVRESQMLYDDYLLNDFHKQRTINVIAHELAHNVRHLLIIHRLIIDCLID